MTEIKKINQAIEAAKNVAKNSISSDLIGEFNSIFKEATAAAVNVDVNEWVIKEKRKKN